MMRSKPSHSVEKTVWNIDDDDDDDDDDDEQQVHHLQHFLAIEATPMPSQTKIGNDDEPQRYNYSLVHPWKWRHKA